MARRQSPDPLERYDTPAWITRALIQYGPITGGRVIEPMAGAGAMSDVLSHEAGCDVATFDIEPRAAGIARADAMAPGFFEQIAAKYDPDQISVITNPAFSLAAALWRRTRAFHRVALLVRITWLERTKDREDVADPVRSIVVPRPKFDGRGSDSATVVWACWGDWQPGIVRLTRSEKAALEHAPITRLIA